MMRVTIAATTDLISECQLNEVCVPFISMIKLDRSAVESDVDLHRVMALSPQVCAYIALARESFSIIHQAFLIPSTSSRGAGRATSHLLHSILTYTVIIQFILSGMSGVKSQLASQAHTVA
jgi:hypothetical protein